MELGSLLDGSRALEVGHGILFLSGLIYPILSRTRTSVAMHPSSHSVTLHVRCKYITLATFGKIHRIWHSDALSIKSSLISLISLLGQAKDRVVPAGWSGCLSQKV